MGVATISVADWFSDRLSVSEDELDAGFLVKNDSKDQSTGVKAE